VLLPRRCPLCHAIGPAPCSACRAGFRPAGHLAPFAGLDSLRALFVYEASVRSLLLQLKYRNRRDAVDWLGEGLARAVDTPIGAVTWAPTSPPRRRRRGFDQAELLARSAARRLGVPARPLIVRRTGAAQTGRRADDRRTGPAFTHRRAVPGAVLLVDDVATTGATLRAAATALRAGGAVQVHAVVVAWTPARRSGPSAVTCT
jgi:competence protein ComFC